MKKEQLSLIIGIAAPLLLVTVLLIQLHHGQQNLTRAIVSLHTGRETAARNETNADQSESTPAPNFAQNTPAETGDTPAKPTLPTQTSTQDRAPEGPPLATSTPKPLSEPQPLPGELIEAPTTETSEPQELHLTYQPVTINHFYPRLQAFGRWFVHPRHGNVWMPHASRRNAQWRPFAHNGRWYYTQNGWHWQSNYKWGGTTFHHGRWFWDQDQNGWVWVPGREWSPAWVTWRDHGDQIGWAPLPPTATTSTIPTRSSRPTGTSGVHIDYGLQNNHFVFVPKADLLAENPFQFALAEEDSVVAFQNSRSRDRITLTAQRAWANFGVPRQEMARAIGSPIEIVAVDLRNPYQPRVVTMQDIESAIRTPEDTQENSNPASPDQRPRSAAPTIPRQTFVVPSAASLAPQRGTSTANPSSQTPIVITGTLNPNRATSRRQQTNPSGLGTRRGQPRPNLATRRPPKSN